MAAEHTAREVERHGRRWSPTRTCVMGGAGLTGQPIRRARFRLPRCWLRCVGSFPFVFWHARAWDAAAAMYVCAVTTRRKTTPKSTCYIHLVNWMPKSTCYIHLVNWMDHSRGPNHMRIHPSYSISCRDSSCLLSSSICPSTCSSYLAVPAAYVLVLVPTHQIHHQLAHDYQVITCHQNWMHGNLHPSHTTNLRYFPCLFS
jgi:hypothetical protein